MAYGYELVLDLRSCTVLPCNRATMRRYFRELCLLIDMKRANLYFWDYHDDPAGYKHAAPHLKGTSAVQFIQTSNITVHTLDDLRKVFINIFSCKPFDYEKAMEFTVRFFNGVLVTTTTLERE